LDVDDIASRQFGHYHLHYGCTRGYGKYFFTFFEKKLHRLEMGAGERFTGGG
jgi:hypothetical protein